jgi:hypothetical protein
MRNKIAWHDYLQWALGATAVVAAVSYFGFEEYLTTRAVLKPVGGYTVPFDTHGGTVFINSAEHAGLLSWWVVTAVLVLGQLCLNRARRRSRGE